jgi:5-methylcytosine-specific restriction endonuclease McrA
LGAQSEPYTRDSIAERDGYLCGLCRGDVDMDLSYPDPMSPSVDHVIPLSTGGNDTVANVQLAHLRCNLSKGPRALVS